MPARLALVGALLIAAVVVPSARAAAPQALTADNHWAGDRSTVSVVTIPRTSAVEVDPFVGSSQIVIRGSGDVVGLVLRQRDVAQPIVIAAARYLTCSSTGCSSRVGVTGNQVPTQRGPDSVLVLPAGRYDAYLLAHAGTADVTLRLPGLAKNRAVLHPRDPAAFAVQKLAADPRFTPVEPLLFSAGAEHSFRGPGLVLQRLAMAQSMSTVGESGSCLVPGAAPVADVYGVGCQPAGGYDVGVIDTPDPQGGSDGFTAAWFTTRPGSFHAGVYYHQAAPVSQASALQAYLPFRA